MATISRMDDNTERGTTEPVRAPNEPLSDAKFADAIDNFLHEFMDRQAEIIRLSKFMNERMNEINNRSTRAKELIQRELDGSLDEAGIERIIAIATEDTPSKNGANKNKPQTLDRDERIEAVAKAFHELGQSLPAGHFPSYFSNIARALWTPPAENFLESSLLVTLVGEFEMLIGQAIRLSIDKNPNSLNNSGREFTWKEISSHGDLNEFRISVVNGVIEDVLRGSLVNWMEFFESKHNLDTISISRSPEAQELFQRRHCIAHNAGYASPQYIEKTKDFATGVKLGQRLRVDAEYFNKSADTLFLICFSLLWSLTSKLCREHDARTIAFRAFCNCTYRLLQERRYNLIIQIGKLAPFNLLSDKHELIAKVNIWLAHKYSGRFDEVRKEIENFDVTAKSRDFELARYALLDDVENAGKIADLMRRDGKLKEEHYLTWPLLAGVREARAKNEPSE